VFELLQFFVVLAEVIVIIAQQANPTTLGHGKLLPASQFLKRYIEYKSYQKSL
jgi:hypothetical protein